MQNKYSSRNGDGISGIVLHHTASAHGSGDAVHNYLQNSDAYVSIHYTVTADGRVLKGIEEEHAAWHAGRTQPFNGILYTNQNTIGIEIVNKGDGIEPYPDKQIYATLELVKDIRSRYGDIPCVRHRDINSSKIDPSDNFPFHIFNLIPMLTKEQLELVERDYKIMSIEEMESQASEWNALEDFKRGLSALSKPETYKDMRTVIAYGRMMK